MGGRTASLAAAVSLSLLVTACGSDDSETGTELQAEEQEEEEESAEDAETPSSPESSGIRIVSADDAAATIADPPDDLVILDVRTPDEFAAGHIEGAVMLDFYREDFAEQVAALDRDVPYVIYCRSGSRSGQTRELMSELGFAAVDDVDGGVISWADAGLPFVVTE